ncbi:MAG: flavin reductase family protein [Coriobacteriia bacterium]|nr:flavin reductase family protein [Coriobacteriia bacterium]
MKKQLSAKPLLYPMPTPLVAAAHEGRRGVFTVAWIGMVSGTPPTIGMAVRATRNTLELIEASGVFSVNVPRVGQEAIVDFCGIVSGRDTDKFGAAGITAVAGTVTGAPMVAECPFNIECRVVGVQEMGEYRLVMGEIVETHADEEILAEDGKTVDVGLLDPLVYIPGSREYRGLGPKVADAYSVGIPLKEQS